MNSYTMYMECCLIPECVCCFRVTIILFLDEEDDYIPVLETLTFHNERQKCVNITIIDDAFLERPVEIFKLTLTRTEGLNERIQFSTDEGEIEITENDGTKLLI